MSTCKDGKLPVNDGESQSFAVERGLVLQKPSDENSATQVIVKCLHKQTTCTTPRFFKFSTLRLALDPAFAVPCTDHELTIYCQLSVTDPQILTNRQTDTPTSAYRIIIMSPALRSNRHIACNLIRLDFVIKLDKTERLFIFYTLSDMNSLIALSQ